MRNHAKVTILQINDIYGELDANAASTSELRGAAIFNGKARLLVLLML